MVMIWNGIAATPKRIDLGAAVGWQYRREVTITENTGGDLTNFQVPIDVDTVEAFEAGKINADFSDMRVRASDGSTDLDFYLEYGAGEISDEDNWWRWPENPVLSPTGAAWDAFWVAPDTVINVSGTYYMYYTGKPTEGSTTWQIGLATSADGISWSKSGSNPILTPGAGGSWDDGGVAHMQVIWEGGTDWYAWYAGHEGSGVWKVGYATSNDGVSWSKSGSNPVMSGTGGEWDSAFVQVGRVWKEDATYYMVYFGGTDGSDSTTWDIGLATSSDRTTWSKSGSNPVLEGVDDTWEDAVLVPEVVKIGSTYYMFYQGNTNTGANSAIGVATSSDLTTWSKSGDNPFPRDGYWDTGWNENPVLVKIGDAWHMYYMGSIGSGANLKYVGLQKFYPTRLWAEVPSLAASANTTVYVYYGNPAAVDASSGANTFPDFFEDFTGGTPFAQWTNAGSYTGGTDRGDATCEKYAANTNSNYFIYTTSTVATPPFVAEVRARVDSDWANEYGWNWRLDVTDGGGALANAIESGHYKDGSNDKFFLRRYVGSAISHTTNETRSINATWDKLSLRIASAGSIVLEYNELTRSLTIAQNPPAANFVVQMNTSRPTAGADYTTVFDKVWLREYASTEPSVSVGAEEAAP